jgi:hypothetical protein
MSLNPTICQRPCWKKRVFLALKRSLVPANAPIETEVSRELVKKGGTGQG